MLIMGIESDDDKLPPFDVTWSLCGKSCPITKVEGVEYVEEERRCDNGQCITCQNIAEHLKTLDVYKPQVNKTPESTESY